MKTTIRWAVLVSFPSFFAGCLGQDGTLPSGPSERIHPIEAPVDQPEAGVGFPEVTRPGSIYTFKAPGPYIDDDAMSYTRASRYVLYDDSRFALQYEIGWEFLGTSAEMDGLIALLFDDNRWPPASYPFDPDRWIPWTASATLVGGDLTVSYNGSMSLSGFEDAVYTLTP